LVYSVSDCANEVSPVTPHSAHKSSELGLPDIPIFDFLLRLAVAVGLGALIGVERQVSHHTAGLKTNALVSAGAALFVMLAGYPNEHPDAYSRIAAQIITGIGFLGGGVILRDGLHIRGLTTAATLWCAGAVGALAGSGVPRRAAIGCAAVLIINIVLKPLSRKLGEDTTIGEGISSRYRIRVVCRTGTEQGIRAELVELGHSNRMILQAMKTEQLGSSTSEVAAEFYTQANQAVEIEKAMTALGCREGITTVDWQRVSPS
jgi:putative Mg2+ transporter-C (MgtC) family protein